MQEPIGKRPKKLDPSNAPFSQAAIMMCTTMLGAGIGGSLSLVIGQKISHAHQDQDQDQNPIGLSTAPDTSSSGQKPTTSRSVVCRICEEEVPKVSLAQVPTDNISFMLYANFINGPVLPAAQSLLSFNNRSFEQICTSFLER